MNEIYKGRFLPEISVSMLKEIIALVGDYTVHRLCRVHTVWERSKT